MFLVLIDWQNLYRACKDKIKIDEVLTEIIKKVLERGALSEIRVFVPNYQLTLSPWKLLNQLQLRFGVAVDVCPAIRDGEEMTEEYKDLVDFSVLQWVMKYLHRGVGPQSVVFVSGDGHFMLAARETKNRGKDVEFWMVDSTNTSGAILRYEKTQELQMPELPLLRESNSFVALLDQIATGKQLDNDADKRKITLLSSAIDLLVRFEEPVAMEARVLSARRVLQQKLGVSAEESMEILKALIALDGAKLYSAVSMGIYSDPISSASEFLRELLSPGNKQVG